MYRRSGLYLRNYYGGGTGPISIADLKCVGDELYLVQCGHDRQTVHCSHNDDVSIICDYGKHSSTIRFIPFFVFYSMKYYNTHITQAAPCQCQCTAEVISPFNSVKNTLTTQFSLNDMFEKCFPEYTLHMFVCCNDMWYVIIIVIFSTLRFYIPYTYLQETVQVIRNVKRYGTPTYENCTRTWLREHWGQMICRIFAGFKLFFYLAVLYQVPFAGSGVVRIDLLRFLAGCRT